RGKPGNKQTMSMQLVTQSRPVARLLTVALLVLALTPLCAFAQVAPVPPLLNFQGWLANPNGTPVADGNYSIRFSLWTAATAGSERWSQILSSVAVKNGTFVVLLNVGSGFENGATATTLFNPNLFLEMKVGNALPLSPRQPLVSVPYAFKANS